jgi:hypothetical protein
MSRSVGLVLHRRFVFLVLRIIVGSRTHSLTHSLSLSLSRFISLSLASSLSLSPALSLSPSLSLSLSWSDVLAQCRPDQP